MPWPNHALQRTRLARLLGRKASRNRRSGLESSILGRRGGVHVLDDGWVTRPARVSEDVRRERSSCRWYLWVARRSEGHGGFDQ